MLKWNIGGNQLKTKLYCRMLFLYQQYYFLARKQLKTIFDFLCTICHIQIEFICFLFFCSMAIDRRKTAQMHLQHFSKQLNLYLHWSYLFFFTNSNQFDAAFHFKRSSLDIMNKTQTSTGPKCICVNLNRSRLPSDWNVAFCMFAVLTVIS